MQSVYDSQRHLHRPAAWVAVKAWPLLPGECMSLKGQLLGINCDCDSAEWQQLCSTSKEKIGAGRGEQSGGRGVKQREGGTAVNSVGFQGGLPILDTWQQPGTWRPGPRLWSRTPPQGRTRVMDKGNANYSSPIPETSYHITVILGEVTMTLNL